MARTIKQLLPATETEIFRNWNDFFGAEVKAVSIWLCNTSASSVDVWLSFCVLSGYFSAGLVLSKTSIAANTTIQIPIETRIISMDESIRAFCSTANAVALSIDLVGDIEPEGEEVPIP